MNLQRRDFLKRSALLLPSAALAPRLFLKAACGAPAGTTRNLILFELFGGNDGFNTVVPFGVDGGAYYGEYRQQIAIPEPQVLKLAGQQVGFHPAMAALKGLYDQGRVALVQGVSYPNPSFSHEVSRRVWYSGDPAAPSGNAWLARFLELFPNPAFPCVADISSGLSGITQGFGGFVPAIESLDNFVFPSDGDHPEDAANRKATFLAMASALASAPGAMGSLAATSAEVVELIDAFAGVAEIPYVGNYPDHYFAGDLQLVARLLASGLGLRTFHIGFGGFDTHEGQNAGGYHDDLLGVLSDGIAALHADLVALGIDQDTLIVVFSEFGRTVYENGSGGTDHGTVGPVLVVGSGVQGGVVTAHPSLDPANLTENQEPPPTADFRDVFGTVLSRWYGATQADLGQVFPAHGVTDLGFLP